jgi:hypothetical protein
MRMRLAGYARRWTPVSGETTSRKALILGAIVAAHLAVISVWLLAPAILPSVWGEGGGGTGEVREVIRYFDITPESPSGTMTLSPELADSLGIVQASQ